MKTTLFAAALATTLLAAVSGGAMAGECSNASLQGHYTYWLQGFDSAGKPFAEVGQEHFDGAGNIATKSNAAGSATMSEDKGTYTINADCSGTSTYASGGAYNIFVAPSGDSFVFSSSKEGVIQAGENTRVDQD